MTGKILQEEAVVQVGNNGSFYSGRPYYVRKKPVRNAVMLLPECPEFKLIRVGSASKFKFQSIISDP